MKPSACLSPIRVYNKSRGMYYSVPCGHCSACIVNKGFSRTIFVEQKFLQYPFRYFFTLTYNNEHLPIARFDGNALFHPHDKDRFGVFHHVEVGDFNFVNSSLFLEKTLSQFQGLPVLSHRDIINFKKRLRYYLHKDNEEFIPFYLYACGEYGSTTYRPHYHFLLSSPKQLHTLESCISKAWSVCVENSNGRVFEPFGFIDFQVCTSDNGIGYVAQYLNCTTHLPFILGRTIFRPFSTTSRRLEFIQPMSKELQRDFYNKPVEKTTRRLKTGKLLTTANTRLSLYKVFPFISGFSRLTHEARVVLYGIYDRFPCWTSKSFALNIYPLLSGDENLDQIHFINLYAKKSIKNEYSEEILFQGRDECIFALYDYSIRPFDTRQQSLDCLERLYNCSRIVCNNARILGISVDEYVSQIESYESGLELYRLRQFYEYQQSLLDPYFNAVELPYIFTLYYHTDMSEMSISQLYRYMNQFNVSSPVSFNDIPSQKSYKFLCDKILKDTTKTKKRNDVFASRGLVPKRYLPHISNKLLTLLNF